MARLVGRIPLSVRVRAQRAYLYGKWIARRYPVPAPQVAKLGVLARYGDLAGTWIESGTYLGDTTRVLARKAERVYTIEPSSQLAERARARLADLGDVQVLEGLSEDLLPGVLEDLTGSVSFWLDGHAYGGLTHSGSKVTPIREELTAISACLPQFSRIAVFVDDFRGFGGRRTEDGDYPPRSALVDWADAHALNWTVEHDIFVAWS
ncbi:MAG: hypothetical protein ACYC0W_11415 [Candidatus Nanopelagicales bacterium]